MVQETKGTWYEIDCAAIKENIFQQIIEGGRGNPNFDALDFWCEVRPNHNQQTPQTPERIPSDSQLMISVRSHGEVMQALRAGYVQHGLLQFTNQCPWLYRLRELWEQEGLSEQGWTVGSGLDFLSVGLIVHNLIKYDCHSSPVSLFLNTCHFKGHPVMFTGYPSLGECILGTIELMSNPWIGMVDGRNPADHLCYLNHLWSIHGTLRYYTSTASPGSFSKKKSDNYMIKSKKIDPPALKQQTKKTNQLNSWVFPKIGVPPKHPF